MDELNSFTDDTKYGGYKHSANWNIRRCCARQVDILGRISDIHMVLLQSIYPLIKNSILSNDVYNREAGVLVLGTLAADQNYLGLDLKKI